MTTVSDEYIDGILLRVHRDGGGYGDPYVAVCFVVADWGWGWWRWWVRQGPVAEVKGLVANGLNLRTFTEVCRAIEKHLRLLGFTRMRYERRGADGKSLWREKAL